MGVTSTPFNVLTWGSDELPPLVCVHGVGGHARRFERLARMLADRVRVIAYDLRGHGRSPWSGDQTLAAHARDLEQVMDACGAKQAVLVGHSLGARVGIEFAAAHGERITALVLLDPPLFTPPATMHAAAAQERSGRGHTDVDAAIEARRVEAGLVHTPRALLEEEMAEHLVADEDGRFRFRYSREAAARAYEELAEAPARLKEIVCPTLLVRAERSDLLSEEAADRAAAELRRCRVATVPGSHVVLWDALAETSALVRDFVTEPSRA